MSQAVPIASTLAVLGAFFKEYLPLFCSLIDLTSSVMAAEIGASFTFTAAFVTTPGFKRVN